MEQADYGRLSAPYVFSLFIHCLHLQERACPMQTTTAGTIRLTRTAEIPEGTGREFKVGERYIAVFCSEGHFYAIEDDCPHAGAPLNDGTVHRGIVACLRHGWRFDLRDGRCVNFSGAPPVVTFPVTIQGEDIYITLPDAAPSGS
jgi:nitrite reductase/ring-hydroxylating ferredoxin subunit